MSIYISPTYHQQHFALLADTRGLYQLFDKLHMLSVFTIQENSIVVNLDNITFGPQRYAVTITDSHHLYHRIIYYCVLYFIFEKDNQHRSLQTYDKLLQYIIETHSDFYLNGLPLTPEETKVYLIKFLNLLWIGRHNHKLIVEQLKNVPQIDLLLTQLFMQMTGVQKLDIESNSKTVQQNLQKHLGITFQFLSYQVILFQQLFQVQIREFSESNEFVIFELTSEQIDQIRRDFSSAQSACFKDIHDQFHNFQYSWSNKVIKLMKKQIAQSIQLDEDQELGQEHTRQAQFEEVLKDTLFDRFPLVEVPRGGFKKAAQKVYQQSPLTVQYKETTMQNHTEIALECQDDSPKKTNVSLDDDETAKKQSNFSDPSTKIGQLVNQNVKSQFFLQGYAQEQQNRYTESKRLQKNKTQTCLLPLFTGAMMSNSSSSKLIKSDNTAVQQKKSTKTRKQRRVPSFVINRMVAKLAGCLQPHRQSIEIQQRSPNTTAPKITFNYPSI